MPLQAPNLDDRKFEDLLSEAVLRIQRYNPAWTDFNDSDPGITLTQLFAWFTELMLYRLNQVPERNYIKFLQLMGLELRAAQPATAHLTLEPSAGAVAEPVRPLTQFSAQSDDGQTLTFETETGLDLVRVKLTDVQVFDGASFSVVTAANDPGDPGFAPLGVVPQIGSALYLGFAPPEKPIEGRIFPQQIRLRVFLSEAPQIGDVESASASRTPAVSPVELTWEYRPAADPKRWRPLNLFLDETLGFTREGYILIEGPAQIALSDSEGKVSDKRYWLRARLAKGSYPTGRAPQIDFVRVNTVPAVNLSTVREEDAGTSDGSPSQVFQLAHRPVLKSSVQVTVEPDGQASENWIQVEDLLASIKDDPHYTVNANTGQIQFGDGTSGRIPPARAIVVAQTYRYGGGKGGNVAPGAISGPNPSGVESVKNERPAVGGRDEQSVDELKQRAPHELRSRNRAVTAEDYAYLAGQAGGVAKATAVALMHPDHTGIEVPGAVTVVVVPDTDDSAPSPSADQLQSVARFLDPYRLLTTEVYVKGPKYIEIEVEALVSAQPYASFDAVTENVIAALNYYLDPLARLPQSGRLSEATMRAAGIEGWQFGESLHPTTLFAVILGVDGVAFVRSLRVSAGGAPLASLSDPVSIPADGLVSSGRHAITVVPA